MDFIKMAVEKTIDGMNHKFGGPFKIQKGRNSKRIFTLFLLCLHY
ncbi:hypothetical protein [Bacillus massiliigorillae]|nr:hypothetical protein [Bacillus massiliigorillae]